MLFPNDLSLHMVWAHLTSDLQFREKDKDDQKRWAATVHGLLKESGIPIDRNNIFQKYRGLIQD